MTDDGSNEIDKLLEQIREKLKLPTATNLDDTTTWTTGDSMNYKDSMIDTSYWSLPAASLAPLTSTQIHNMGIGTTGSSPGWATTNNFNFNLEKSRNKEFETHMPGLHKMNEMREMFQAFKKAYDHMRTIYDLVHDEYLERKKEQ